MTESAYLPTFGEIEWFRWQVRGKYFPDKDYDVWFTMVASCRHVAPQHWLPDFDFPGVLVLISEMWPPHPSPWQHACLGLIRFCWRRCHNLGTAASLLNNKNGSWCCGPVLPWKNLFHRGASSSMVPLRGTAYDWLVTFVLPLSVVNNVKFFNTPSSRSLTYSLETHERCLENAI